MSSKSILSFFQSKPNAGTTKPVESSENLVENNENKVKPKELGKEKECDSATVGDSKGKSKKSSSTDIAVGKSKDVKDNCNSNNQKSLVTAKAKPIVNSFFTPKSIPVIEQIDPIVIDSATISNYVDTIAERFELDMLKKRQEDKAFANKGNGINPFFAKVQTSMDNNKTKNLASSSSNSSKGVDMDIGIEDKLLLFPCIPHVGLPAAKSAHIVSLPQFRSRTNNENISNVIVDLTSDYSLVSCDENDRREEIVIESPHDFRCIWSRVMAGMSHGIPYNIDATLVEKIISSIPRDFGDIIPISALKHSNPVRSVRNWLEIWAGKRKKNRKNKNKSRKSRRNRDDESYDEESDDGSELSNLMILHGPCGSGKTTTVHMCSKELGLNIIEINVGMMRSQSHIKKYFTEASQSESVVNSSNIAANTSLNLILIDDADIVFDEDVGMYQGIAALVRSSKCPIILTMTSPPIFQQYFKQFNPLMVAFSKPNETGIVQKYQPNQIDRNLYSLACAVDGDIRSILTSYHVTFPSLSTAGSQSSIGNTGSAVPEKNYILDWLHQHNVAIGLLDSVEREFTAADKAMARSSHKSLAIPLIYDVVPRQGYLAGGYIVAVTGRNFMQDNSTISVEISGASLSNHCSTRLLGENIRVQSDTSLLLLMPALPAYGTYLIEVSISCEQGHGVRSSMMGACCSWFEIINPSKATKKVAVARASFQPASPRLNFFVKQSNVHSSSDDDVQFVETALPPVGRKRLSNRSQKDEDATENEIFNESTTATKRRRRNVVNSDDDEEEDPDVKDSAKASEFDVDAYLNEQFNQVIRSLIAELKSHKYIDPFLSPVLPEDAPDYEDFIAKPMDLSTIEQTHEEALYSVDNDKNQDLVSLKGFVDDVTLIFNNCYTYNDSDSRLVKHCKKLQVFFETLLYQKLQSIVEAQPLLQEHVTFKRHLVVISSPLYREKISIKKEIYDAIADNESQLCQEEDDEDCDQPAVVVMEEVPVVETLPTAISDEEMTALLAQANERRKNVSSSSTNCVGNECCNEDSADTYLHACFDQDIDSMNNLASLLDYYSVSDCFYSTYNDYYEYGVNEGNTSNVIPRNYCDVDDHHPMYSEDLLHASVLLSKISTSVFRSGIRVAEVVTDATSEPAAQFRNRRVILDDCETTNDAKCDKMEVVHKSKVICIDEDEDAEFDDDYDDDDIEDDVMSIVEGENDTTTDAAVVIPWHEDGAYLPSPYLRHMYRKKLMTSFIHEYLNNINHLTTYSNLLLPRSTLLCGKSSISDTVALEYIPYLGQILHSDRINTVLYPPASRTGSRKSTGSSKMKYSYMSSVINKYCRENYSLHDNDLDYILDLGFMDSQQCHFDKLIQVATPW